MRFYMDKQEKYPKNMEEGFSYHAVDEESTLASGGFWGVNSQNIMAVTVMGTVYYSFLVGGDSCFKRLDRFMSENFRKQYLPIDEDETKKGYCEVSEDFVLKYLEHLNAGGKLEEDKGKYTKLINRIKEVSKREHKKEKNG